jgi:hypothetical protein
MTEGEETVGHAGHPASISTTSPEVSEHDFVDAGAPGSAATSYFERQWVPWWIHALTFGCGFALVFGLFRVFIAVQHPTARFPLAAQLGVAAGTGLFGLLVVFTSVVFTTLTVKDGILRVGGGHGFFALHDIEAAVIVRDGELRRLRGNMTQSLGPRGQRRSRGMCAGIGMHEAVLVSVPTSRTKQWLLGTHHPDEFLRAIENGRRADRDTSV